jgi:protein SCO1/2
MKRFAPLLALALCATAGCTRHTSERATPTTTLAAPPQASSSHAPALLARALATNAPSIYELPALLTDDTGLARQLDSFRGHPVLITMFYGSCASACPLITSDLKRIERQLPDATRAQLRVLMVSFDPARDTPAALARLKRERGVDGTRWTFASASDDDARALAGVLGIRYRHLDDGSYFHSSAIVLLDAEGRPQARLDGLGRDVDPIVSALAGRS